MKKFLLFALFVGVLVAFIIPQFFLSKSFAMDRATTIEAPIATVQGHIADLKTWDSWTAWNSAVDPTLVNEYTGEPGMPGHKMAWKGDELGEGSLTLTTIEPGRVAYDMDFGGGGLAQGALVLESKGPTTTAVTWEMTGEMEGMPWNRYFGLLMDKMVGPDFEAGLADLKSDLERADVPADSDLDGALDGAPDDGGTETSSGQ